MDLGLYVRVLWRFRVLVGLGLVLALGLALLSVVNVSTADGISFAYREQPRWQSRTLLMISQPGFPEGQATQSYRPSTGSGIPTPATDPSRLSNLGFLYAQLANGDEVQRRFRRGASRTDEYSAAPYNIQTQTGYQFNLPLLSVVGFSHSAAGARAAAARASEAFSNYLRDRQDEAAMSEADRIVVPTLEKPTAAQQVGGPKKTIPVIVFLAIMMAVIGLAFVLENLRPQIRVVRELESSRKLA